MSELKTFHDALQARFFCNAMPWVDCTAVRYHCTKMPDVDLCADAYAEGRFPPGCTAKDFVRIEAGKRPVSPVPSLHLGPYCIALTTSTVVHPRGFALEGLHTQSSGGCILAGGKAHLQGLRHQPNIMVVDGGSGISDTPSPAWVMDLFCGHLVFAAWCLVWPSIEPTPAVSCA